MRNITVKNLIAFRKKTERSKKSFALSLTKTVKPSDNESGGDYWISCVSALCNAFKHNDGRCIIDRREELEEKYGSITIKQTKDRYRKNIDILYNYEHVDLKRWRPTKKIARISQKHDEDNMSIKGFDITTKPHCIFAFGKDDLQEMGAIWFIAQKGGFKMEELGIFTDILYRYLKLHYAREYTINAKYCIAVDVVNNVDVNYLQLDKEEIPKILLPTLDELKKFI